MFICYKFRTMYADMTDVMADRQTTRGDPRITRVGKWMRKFSLDELPQLLNVMNGTMSLVGPRPHAPNTKAADRLFVEVVQQYALRHRVKPGISRKQGALRPVLHRQLVASLRPQDCCYDRPARDSQSARVLTATARSPVDDLCKTYGKTVAVGCSAAMVPARRLLAGPESAHMHPLRSNSVEHRVAPLSAPRRLVTEEVSHHGTRHRPTSRAGT
jgi:hypothetical protein